MGPKALGSDPLKHFHLEPERQKRRRSKTQARASSIGPDRRASARASRHVAESGSPGDGRSILKSFGP